MATRQNIELNFDVQKSQPADLAAVSLGAIIAGGRERNLSKANDDLGFLGGSKPRNQETKREFGELTTQAALNESYKAKIEKLAPTAPLTVETAQVFWAMIQPQLLASLGSPAYETLIAPCQLALVDHSSMSLLTDSAFNRDLILRRYKTQIQQVLSTQAERPIRLQVNVNPNPSQQEAKPVATPAQPQSAQPEHSSTVSASKISEVTVLLERYDDIMGIIDHHPLFRKVTASVEEGGWGLYPQALTRACKEHSQDGDLSTGIEKVIHTIRFTANYRAARNKAQFFWTALRKGTRKEA